MPPQDEPKPSQESAGDRSAPPPQPSSPSQPESRNTLAALFDYIKQWQIIVALIAALVGVWFKFAEDHRKQLEINQKAVAYLRSDGMMKRFWRDPANTINEVQASYPRHAFCAALGVFLAERSGAEVKAVAGVGDAPSANARNAASDALLEETLRIADDAGAERCEIEALAWTTANASTALDEGLEDPYPLAAECAGAESGAEPARSCASLHAETDFLKRQWTPDECLLALDFYAENQCAMATTARRRANLDARERVAAAKDDRVEVEANRVDAIKAACGDAVPLVFVQYASKDGAKSADALQTAEDVSGRLAHVGWRVADPDLEASVSSAADVRYYFDDQEACADLLLDDVAKIIQRPEGKAFRTVSLAGAYKGLARGRMELWLPAGAELKN